MHTKRSRAYVPGMLLIDAMDQPGPTSVGSSSEFSLSDLLEASMPEWRWHTVHRRPCPYAPATAMTALDRLTWQEMWPLRLVTLDHFGGQRIQPRGSVMDTFMAAGYRLVAASRGARVYGTVLGPGVRVLLGFGCSRGQLVTETRVATEDWRSTALFTAYGIAIRPLAGLLRRWWLAAIMERAQWTFWAAPTTTGLR